MLKMKIVLSIILITNIFTLKWNYDHPNGLEPTNNHKNNDEDLLNDDIPDMTNFMQVKETSKSNSGIRINKNVQPGYIDPDVINNSIHRKSSKNNNNKYDFRFAQKQDDEYFNPNSGSTNANTPTKDAEAIRKQALSNGIIKYEGKRTLNFETNEFPEFYNELKSD